MTVGQRIKHKREQFNISQTDFAKKIGVSKQTLYKYENDIITNIPSSIIENIAKALLTTPEYIMGWSEDPAEKITKEMAEDALAKKLFDKYNSVSPEIRAAIDTLLETAKKEKKND